MIKIFKIKFELKFIIFIFFYKLLRNDNFASLFILKFNYISLNNCILNWVFIVRCSFKGKVSCLFKQNIFLEILKIIFKQIFLLFKKIFFIKSEIYLRNQCLNFLLKIVRYSLKALKWGVNLLRSYLLIYFFVCKIL